MTRSIGLGLRLFLASAAIMAIFPGVSASQEERGIDERLSINFPILLHPGCTEFLTEFGSKKKAVEQHALSTGVEEFITMKVPGLPGVTSTMFTDPDEVQDKEGNVLTQGVIYTFIFDRDRSYFAFAISFRFKDETDGLILQRALASKAGLKPSPQGLIGTVECPATGKTRIVNIRIQEGFVTYTVIDQDLLKRSNIDPSEM